MFQAIALSLTVGILWAAVGAVFGKAPNDKRQFLAFVSFESIVYCFSSFAVVRYVRPDIHELLKLAMILIPAGISELLGFWLLKRVMAIGTQSIAWAVLQSALILPFLGGLFLPGSKMSPLSFVGVLVLLGGLALLGKEKPSSQLKQASDRKKYWLLLLCAFFLVGTAQFLQLLPNYMGLSANTLNWRLCFGATLGLLIWNSVAFVNKAYHWGNIWKMSLLYGLVVVAGQFTFYKAADAAAACGWSAAVYPVSLGSCIVLFSLYCFFVRREKLSVRGWLGTLLVSLGVVGLSI